MGEHGFPFSDKRPDVHHPEFKYFHQVYTSAVPDYIGRSTVPILYDLNTGKIASNESFEVIRLLDQYGGDKGPKLFPKDLIETQEWKETQNLILQGLNSGVYKAAFSKSEEELEKVREEISTNLKLLNSKLEKSRYLFGNSITALDIRLFVSLLRYDIVYASLFKLNDSVTNYPNLLGFTRDFYQLPKVASTINLEEIQAAYFNNFSNLNPTGKIPNGPFLDFNAPHHREHLNK